MRPGIGIAVVLVALVAGPTSADVRNSKHNLSVSGPGDVSAQSESRICVFCHSPHGATPVVPLWNHQTSAAVYSTYQSSTLTSPTPLAQPTGTSKLCLSCHDGTIALGQTVNDGLIALVNTGPGGTMPVGSSDLGVDLTDDHPVSFQTNPANPETLDPPPGDPVMLDETGQLQCTSCHDAHVEDRDSVSNRFLVKVNQASAICVTCHRLDHWETNPSSHQSSTAPYGSAQGAHTGYTTVRDNGCESCHRPHAGLTPQRLLKLVEEATCDACHDGSVASLDLSVEFAKMSAHPTFATTPSVHDAAESPIGPSWTLPEVDPGAERHAECPDCHNAHAAFAQTATAPDVSGALSGTWGINSLGTRVDPAQLEYQICYKCHADSANKPQLSGLPNPPYTQRQNAQFNTRLEFDPANPSHHAVEAPGQNGDVPSLIPPFSTGSVIYCSDCHNNNAGPGAGGGGPAGPHGSTFDKILERRFETGDPSPYAEARYALCFKCHDANSVLGDVTFDKHDKHIRDQNASCSICHDPHGVSFTQGSVGANSHLINFDVSVVTPSGSGELRFEDRGSRSGACYLTCHGEDHDPETY